jgi:hypothetical protein
VIARVRSVLTRGLVLTLLPTAACGGGSRGADTPVKPVVADAGLVASADAAPPPKRERPFARTPSEATAIIQHEIDSRMATLWKCVQVYRTANRDAHQTISVNLGIDEDGNLLGVASGDPKKGDIPPPVRTCILKSLHDAAFPRSHAGIITVRQTFQDTAIYPQ